MATSSENNGNPVILFEIDGKIHVAVSVLEYDANAENITDEQRKGVAQVRDLLDTARKERSVGGALIGIERLMAFTNTGPRPRG